MSWSAEQLRWLRALGHEPLQQAPAGAAVGAVVGAAFGRDQAAAENQSRPQAAPTNALAAALARAAGGRDLAGLDIDFDRLRREPALKRALWPRLRALRRGQA